ncbi:unannotated protein [freshwater metagenome]|uniref:Unannotated protein n=1 Tax=freshwater metagenome TaxID=449393 RepID=A0A6J6H8L8_9ZZZZ
MPSTKSRNLIAGVRDAYLVSESCNTSAGTAVESVGVASQASATRFAGNLSQTFAANAS